jgi:WD40 repeat protein
VMVARQLQQTRLQLASTFLDRGYQAERVGDWSKAAGYFAVARTQHDTYEERWSLAISRARSTERILSLQGPVESFVDVAVLPDSRVLALGHSLDHVEVREAESGKQLWQRVRQPVLAAAFIANDVVAVFHPDGWTFHDAATGRDLSTWSNDAGLPCAGRYPIAAAIVNGKLLRVDEGATRIVATDAITARPCVVSQDGTLAAYVDGAHVVHLVSLDDGRELAHRTDDNYNGLRFSRSHGLIIFRQGQLDVVGAPEGDFTIDLPDASFGRRAFLGDPFSGAAVSPDGHLVAIASRRGTTEAMVVDLRSRSIRGVVEYTAGSARLTFSPDGERVFAAGMGNASLLSGWRLPPEELPATPRWWNSGVMFPGGLAALRWDKDTGRYEFLKSPDKVAAESVLQFRDVQLVGDGPLGAFTTVDANGVFLQDLVAKRLLWKHACHACRDISVSYDGSVFSFIDAAGLEVWDTKHDRRLFQETARIRPFLSESAVSRDGRRVAWNQTDTAVVRDLDSGREQTIPLDGAIRQLQFSPDPEQLLTITTRTIRVWNLAERRAVWSRTNEAPSLVTSRWSTERHALILEHGFLATEVLDVDTGERLGWFEVLSRVVTPVEAEVYTNDLRAKAVASETSCDYRLVPQPDEESAETSLANTLQRTGLELRGVQLVAAP